MNGTAKRISLGIDLGAGSLKASLVDETGETLGEAARPIGTANRPQPGWSEQDPADWWQALCGERCPTVLAKRPACSRPIDVAAVGLSGGAHIAVLDRCRGPGPVRPAILWNDQRSAAEAEELHARAGELIVRKLAQPRQSDLDPGAAGLAARRRSRRSSRAPSGSTSPRTTCAARLTGDWTTDYSDVIGALMADAETRDWSPALCELVGWPLERLPPVARAHGEIAGNGHGRRGGPGLRARRRHPRRRRLERHDGGALRLQGAVKPGDGAIKLATAGVVFLAVDRPEVHPPVSCYPAHRRGHVVHGLGHQCLRHGAPLGARPLLRRPARGDRLRRDGPPGRRGAAGLPRG